VFATTGRLDEPFEYWWDVLARVFDPAIDLPATLDVELSTGRRTLSTASPQERTAALWDLYHSLVAMSAEARAEVLLRLVSWSGVCSVDPDNRRMSSRELQQLAEVPGLTIGGHTCDHPSLPRLPYGQARTEISRNKARLEAILQRPVSTFAYPYGAYDTASIEAVRAAGFTAAVTCDSGPVWGGSNPLALPRVDVRATSERPFLLALDALITCGDASAQHS
jgi:peptidoglycan/xylan/chitin deacetylase (PgdA/CDA1 family)